LRIVNQKVELPQGRIMNFEHAERAPGVRVLVTSDDKYLLNKEWRIELNDWDYRLPGGKVFDTINEFIDRQNNPDFDLEHACLLAAKKELKEETGLDIDLSCFSKKHKSTLGSTVIWDLHYYLVNCQGLTFNPCEIQTDEGEQIKCAWLTKEEIVTLFFENKIQEDRSIPFVLKTLFIHSKNIAL